MSDRDTWFNLSSHVYFNLSGDYSKSVLDEEVWIDADRYAENREDFIQKSLNGVEHSPFDFRLFHSFEEQEAKYSENIQLRWNQGYNHAFVFRPGRDEAVPAIRLRTQDRQREVRIFTDAPAAVVYTGGYIENGLPLSNGQKTVPSCGAAFECQNLPLLHDDPDSMWEVTPAKAVWRRQIRWEFSV